MRQLVSFLSKGDNQMAVGFGLEFSVRFLRRTIQCYSRRLLKAPIETKKGIHSEYSVLYIPNNNQITPFAHSGVF